ncbi:DEAD/DEAH box helicase family protein [Thermus tengchongensis]|uniref:DEAD/DEAH box helicase family protein n=1 Tax=Thermus tengchongensis TaxID=1214928 RepID=UPI001F31D4B7|nr:DEAD/DEAH box helicase family protein [Thermus tengchongensis]
MPTGAGKTMTLLLAVFRMALEPRCAHRRIVYVVNRRLVVDQALELAMDIKARLEGALGEDSCLGRAARRLAALGGGVPLEVVRLRGGVPKPSPSLTDPARPAVILATVDMAGSRLLHRGYGVSRSFLPIEAALFGVDALFLLDEAHLETPFWHTLRQVMEATKGSLRPGLVAVALTATPQALQGQGRVFTLDQHDQDHPMLRKRLRASKRVQLIKVEEICPKPW